MTTNNSTSQPAPLSLGKRMLIGGWVGLLVIAFFLFPTDTNPEWSRFWMIRPLIITPFAGAMAGLCNYYIMHFRHQFGVHRIVALIISIIVSIVGLWMGIVLGLDGTLWN